MSIGMTLRRYANIDGLRAIAAVGVMIEHLFGDLLRQTAPAAGPMNAVGNALVHSVSLGRFGVALFFLISGFVVPFSIGGARPRAHGCFGSTPHSGWRWRCSRPWHGLPESRRAWRPCWPT
jgi:peptidoglycan/LPS O-acetylase OafA/YrhL